MWAPRSYKSTLPRSIAIIVSPFGFGTGRLSDGRDEGGTRAGDWDPDPDSPPSAGGDSTSHLVASAEHAASRVFGDLYFALHLLGHRVTLFEGPPSNTISLSKHDAVIVFPDALPNPSAVLTWTLKNADRVIRIDPATLVFKDPTPPLHYKGPRLQCEIAGHVVKPILTAESRENRLWRALVRLPPGGWSGLTDPQLHTLALLSAYVPLVVADGPPPPGTPVSHLVQPEEYDKYHKTRERLRCVGRQSVENMDHLRLTSALFISLDPGPNGVPEALAGGMLILHADPTLPEQLDVSPALFRPLLELNLEPAKYNLPEIRDNLHHLACDWTLLWEVPTRFACPSAHEPKHRKKLAAHFEHGTVPRAHSARSFLQRVQTTALLIPT